MMVWIFTFLAGLFGFDAAQPGGDVRAHQAGAQPVVVVELFTSQGCGMCPDANVLLSEIAQDEDVLALAFAVTYWDVYGWQDRYARPEFTQRQKAYVNAGTPRRLYTPQFIINGGPERMRYNRAAIGRAAANAAPVPSLAGTHTADGVFYVTIDGPERERPADVWLVHYQPGTVIERIEGGSNAGRDMAHYNMVIALESIGGWAGGPAEFEAPAPEAGLESAILVQDGPGGAILTAARLTQD